MKFNILKTEINEDPLVRGYSGMSNQEIANSLNEENIPVQGSVPISKLIKASAKNDLIYKLKQGAESGDKDKRRLCDAALTIFTSPHISVLDVTDPEVDGMLAALVFLSIVTQEEVNEIKSYGVVNVSRASQLGLGKIKLGYVQKARE